MTDCSQEHGCSWEGCSKVYKRADHLRRHVLTHTGTRNFQCDQCPLAFYGRNHLVRHQQIHLVEKPYLCDFEGCNEAFSKKNQLKRHQCVHTGQLPYGCEYCDKAFDYPSKLKKHINSVHLQIGEKKYVCTIEGCEESFLKFLDLRRHIKTHDLPNQVIPCPTCGKELKRKGMKRHMELHDNEPQNWPCPIEGCPKSFSRKGNVNFHVRFGHPKPGHSERTLYECSEENCGKMYLSIQRYYQHQRKRHNKIIKRGIEIGREETSKENKTEEDLDYSSSEDELLNQESNDIDEAFAMESLDYSDILEPPLKKLKKPDFNQTFLGMMTKPSVNPLSMTNQQISLEENS